MNITLVIMAAGLGSRFKGGIKQLAKVGPNGETIMELTIKDAKKIGYNKVIFIIREELKQDFLDLVIPHIDMEYEFAYQDISDITISIPFKREKPWGTGHALLSLRNIVDNNFVILNADDYYGIDALQKVYNHFKEEDTNVMVAYKLKNTFTSSNLGNRGVCLVKNHYLTNIKETYKIEKIKDSFKNPDGALEPDTYVSMNLWGFNKNVFPYFQEKFNTFLKQKDALEKEFLIPDVVNDMIKDDIKIKVYETDDICLGITYQEDVNLFRKEM
jgi:choline kinase